MKIGQDIIFNGCVIIHDNVLITKYGRAKLDKDGYWRITSSNNHRKFLHRLIYEDYYNITIPKNYVIHHKNGIKTDNSISNLQLVENKLHSKSHNIHSVFSEETKKKMSESNAKYWLNKHFSNEHCEKISKSKKGKELSNRHKQNISLTTKTEKLPYRVIKRKKKSYKQGFIYKYRYYENGKRKEISSVDMNELKQKVMDNGLEWIEYYELKSRD